jgi:glycerate 2-kinase
MSHRELLELLFRAGVDAADPRAATARAVATLDLNGRVAVASLGKASSAMSAGAIAALHERGVPVVAGLTVSHQPEPDPIPEVVHIVGDHPEPGDGSARAAEAIGRFTEIAHEADHVLVLLSGGATSLCAAPVDGVPVTAMRETFQVLLTSGVPIDVMNAFRRRILRWGGGRLAVALQPARVHCLIVSDVMGNNLEAIGSGPCVPDPLLAGDVLGLRQQHDLQALPFELTAHLRRVADGEEPETPKPGNPAFRMVETQILLDNESAVRAVQAEAIRSGFVIGARPAPLEGEAAAAGRTIAGEILRLAGDRSTAVGERPLVAVWGGETVVTVAGRPGGRGGRCQELALACAHSLYDAGESADGILVLAAGTDGRDGPTDAAGALVDAETWSRIRAAGRDPSQDLANHDAYAALKAADALLIKGATGTNVNDLVIAAGWRTEPPAE